MTFFRPRPLASLASLPLALVAAALLLGFALLPVTRFQLDAASSSMTIDGTSTLHDWTCEAKGLDGTFRAEVDSGAAPPVASVSTADVQVAVEQIECGKDRMNSNLREALKATSYPTIYFRLADASLAALPDSSDAWMAVDAAGELIIAGARRQVELDVRAQRMDDGRLRFVGETPLTMTDFDVEPPSFMFGSVKTGDEVTVRFDVIARPETSQ